MAKSEVEYLPIKCGVKCDCPAGGGCKEIPTEVNPDENGRVQILFVGHVGGKGDQLRGRHFAGHIGKRLRTLILISRKLSGVGFGVAFGNVSRNCVVKGAKATEDEFYYCMPHLLVDIDTLLKRGLKYIMPLGAVTLDIVLGKIRPTSSLTMANYIGKPLSINGYPFNKVTVIPMVHPARIVRDNPSFSIKNLTSYEKTFIKCLTKLFYDKERKAANEKKIPDPIPVDSGRSWAHYALVQSPEIAKAKKAAIDSQTVP